MLKRSSRGSSPSKSFPARDLSSVHKNTNYILNDILRSSTVSQSNNITESRSNFLQVIESSPIRNEPWNLTGQTVPSYATAEP